MVPVNDIILKEKEREYVLDCLDRHWIGVGGEMVQAFESKFPSALKYRLAVNSGTAALQLALLGLGVGENDYVVIPAYSCGATIATVKQVGAVPLICDIEKDTLGMNWLWLKYAIKKYGSRIKAVQLVHVYGQPAKGTLEIVKACRENDIKLIMDSSEAHGAMIGTQLLDGWADVSAYSCRAEKMIGVGEGGIVCSNDKDVIERCKFWASRCKPNPKVPYWYTESGFNYLMTEIPAAIGLAQIERLFQKIAHRKKIRERYKQELKELFWFPEVDEIGSAKVRSAYWLHAGLANRDAVKLAMSDMAAHLRDRGFGTRPAFYPLHWLPIEHKTVGGMNVAPGVFSDLLIFPSGETMTEEIVYDVAMAVKELLL